MSRMRDSLVLSRNQLAQALGVLAGVCLCWILAARFMPPFYHLPGLAQGITGVLLFLALYIAPPAAVAWFGYHTRKPLPALLLGLIVPLCTSLLFYLCSPFPQGPWWVASLLQDDRIRFGFSAFFAASSLTCWGAGGAFLHRDKVATALLWVFALLWGLLSYALSIPWD